MSHLVRWGRCGRRAGSTGLRTSQNGNFVYTYADPDYCQCLYVGGSTEYAAYQRLAVQQEIAEEREAAAMDWGAWGPWWW